MKKIRFLIVAAISFLPLNILRCLLYNWLFGHTIKNAKVGFGTILNVRHAQLNNCSIGKFNLFLGPITVSIKPNARIGPFNTFSCGLWTALPQYKDKNYARELFIEEDAFISGRHFFDLAGRFILGKSSWIAGRHSQFWTHGAGIADRDITIGRDCYIAAAVRFAPGSALADNSLVALAAVVTKKFDTPNVLIAGVPAEIIKQNYHWKSQNL